MIVIQYYCERCPSVLAYPELTSLYHFHFLEDAEVQTLLYFQALYLINLITQESPRLAQDTKEFRGLTHCLKSPKFVNQPFP